MNFQPPDLQGSPWIHFNKVLDLLLSPDKQKCLLGASEGSAWGEIKFCECWGLATAALFTWMGFRVDRGKYLRLRAPMHRKPKPDQHLCLPRRKQSPPSSAWPDRPGFQPGLAAWSAFQLWKGRISVQTSLLQRKPAWLVQVKQQKKKERGINRFGGLIGFPANHKQASQVAQR